MRCCPQVSHSLWILCGLLPDPLERQHSRFCAQVHGIANDTIKFVQNIVNTEINSATDNPVSFPQKLEIPPRFLNERSLFFFFFFLTAIQDGICRKRRDHFRGEFPWRIPGQGMHGCEAFENLNLPP